MLTPTSILRRERLSHPYVAAQGDPHQCPASSWLVPRRQLELNNVFDSEMRRDIMEAGSWRVSTGEGF
jgi:hypothetical protein